MQRWMISCLAAAIACSVASGDASAPREAELPPRLQQQDRRVRMFPEFVVESGGRRGACDVLTFTADGKHLLAAGDDKVVRDWEYREGRIVPGSMKILRWPVWREKRGAIYSLAASPDPQAQRVAIGGLGPYTTSAAVLDRQSGAILYLLHATDFKQPQRMSFGSIRAIAFSPRGDRIALGSADGSVWLWHPKSERLQRLGRHPRLPNREREFNLIRLIRFLEEDELLSVAESGDVLRWDLAAEPPKPHKLDILGGLNGAVFEAKLSRDGKWLAAAAKKTQFLAVRSLDGEQSKDIELEKGAMSVSLAFDAKARQLAVGIRPSPGKKKAFLIDKDDRICVYDLSGKKAVLRETLPHSWHVDGLAFHPDGRHLSVAGGDNHEVTLWDLNQPKQPVDVLAGVGRGIWGVTIAESKSKDGLYLGFQTQRERQAKHPNRRGRGDWKVFDLQQRKLISAPAAFAPVPPKEETHGWRVKPDPEGDSYVWYVEHEAADICHKLPLNRERESKPNCFAFLPGGVDQPVRLAVGHYYGVSVYELTKNGARRLWLGVGHEGEVMALAVSPDRKWLVSASTDQTVSAWSLRGWPCGNELGAAFRSDDGRVFVEKVDLFSPAWEAGLSVGNEVVMLKAGSPKPIFAGGPEAPSGSAEACLEALQSPEPGEVLNFHILRPGNKEVFKLATTVRRRPLWRFFPTVTNQWVLWMWGHHYYDTSTNGDSYVGWQMNQGADLKKTPTFYRVEQFRELFHNGAVIDKLLESQDVGKALQESDAGLEPPNFGKFESVTVRIEPHARKVKDGCYVVDDTDVEVALDVKPRIENPDYVPVQAELWINDYRLKSWKLNGKAFNEKLTIPRSKLRAGDNDLVLQCYNKKEGRSARGRLEAAARVHCRRVKPKPKLWGLVVGINDYSQSPPPDPSKPTKRLFDLKYPLDDVRAIKKAWKEQEGFYAKVEIDLLGENRKVYRQTILEKLQELAEKVGPDDHAFVFFAAHGWIQGAQGKPVPAICCSDFDSSRLDETALRSQVLYEKLANIPCRKVVFLDTCRSGGFVRPLRDLTPGGRGPTILAACDRNESSYEDPTRLRHGLFAYAILEATGKKFADADLNADGKLDAQEVFAYASERVPQLAAEIFQEPQTPVSFPAELERFTLLGRPKAGESKTNGGDKPPQNANPKNDVQRSK